MFWKVELTNWGRLTAFPDVLPCTFLFDAILSNCLRELWICIFLDYYANKHWNIKKLIYANKLSPSTGRVGSQSPNLGQPVISFFPLVSAITCYKCESYRDFRCLDPFDYRPHIQVNCDYEPFVRDRKPVFCEKSTELREWRPIFFQNRLVKLG